MSQLCSHSFRIFVDDATWISYAKIRCIAHRRSWFFLNTSSVSMKISILMGAAYASSLPPERSSFSIQLHFSKTQKNMNNKIENACQLWAREPWFGIVSSHSPFSVHSSFNSRLHRLARGVGVAYPSRPRFRFLLASSICFRMSASLTIFTTWSHTTEGFLPCFFCIECCWQPVLENSTFCVWKPSRHVILWWWNSKGYTFSWICRMLKTHTQREIQRA